MENQVISDLEREEPCILFSNRRGYNRINYLDDVNRKVFLLMCKNFFSDMKNEHNMKIKTIKYWFLHNLSLLFEQDKNLLNEFVNISDELDILVDYYRVVEFGYKTGVDRYIFLPCMRLFSSWCGGSNLEKVDMHHLILKDLIYLDDNYFFLLGYLRGHSEKFLGRVLKNDWEMDNGNNVMIHLMRSGVFKNSDCAFRNFRKVINFIFFVIFGGKFMEMMVRKNRAGRKALNLLVYLHDNFYEFMLRRIFCVTTHRVFMERYFAGVTKYINRSFQLEMILGNVEIFCEDKYENLYEKILMNRAIPFYEKYGIINLMLENGLISIDSDRDRLGRKMWDKLHETL